MAPLFGNMPRLDVVRSGGRQWRTYRTFTFVFALHRCVTAAGRTGRAGKLFDHLGDELATHVATTNSELFRSLLVIPSVGGNATNTAIRYGSGGCNHRRGRCCCSVQSTGEDF